MSMAAPTPWKMRITMSQMPAAGPVIQVMLSSEGEEGEDGEAEVVDAHPAVDVAQPARGVTTRTLVTTRKPEDHPQQVEAVAGLQRVDADAAEDVGQRDEDDGAVDRRHEHAQRRDEQRDPLVAVGQRRTRVGAAEPAGGTGAPRGRLRRRADARSAGVGACRGGGAGRSMRSRYLGREDGPGPRGTPSASHRRTLRAARVRRCADQPPRPVGARLHGDDLGAPDGDRVEGADGTDPVAASASGRRAMPAARRTRPAR